MTRASDRIGTEQIKALREKTGAGIMECKKALSQAGGDLEEAIRILKLKGKDIAAAKAHRAAHQGLIGSYVHGGRIGVLVEVNCETDFVARTDQFKNFVHEICLQVASMNPHYVTQEEVPHEEIGETLARLHEEIEEVEEEGAQSIQQAHMEKFYKERVLLDQPFVKDSTKTVQDLLNETISFLRENIVIRRFVRLVLGDA